MKLIKIKINDRWKRGRKRRWGRKSKLIMWHIRLVYELPKKVRQKTKNRMYKTILKKQKFMKNKKIKQDSNWKKIERKMVRKYI